MSGSDDGSRHGEGGGESADGEGGGESADGDIPTGDDAPPESDPADVDASDIEPVGAMIAVAFTGAVVGLVGAGLAPFASDFGLALIGVGVVVALSSPLAYVRLRRRYGS